MKFQVLVAALFFASASAFAPVSQTQRSPALQASNIREEVDYLGNNIAVKNLLENVESSGLLTKVAQSGLLSKAQAAGISLSSLEPLLGLVAENEEILVLVEASTPELLPVLPKIVSLLPTVSGAIPLLATLIQVPPAGLGIAGLGALGAAAGAIVVIPDDTLLQIAGQTFAAGALGAAGIAGIGGSVVLGKVLSK